MPGDPEIWEVSDDSSASVTDTENDSLPTVDRPRGNLSAALVKTQPGVVVLDDDRVGEYQEDAFLKLKTNLREHFDYSSLGTSFFHQGILPRAPNPGVSIHGYGTIGFPLTEHDFEKIMAASGLESGEFFENTPTPSHVYTIPGNKISTRNPAWTSAIQSIVEKVKIELGLENKSAHAELFLLERALPTCFSGPEYQPLLAKLREEKGPLWIMARAESYIPTNPTLDNRCKAIENLSRYQVETDWSSNQYELALSACAPPLSVSDVAQLIQVASVFSEKQIIEILEIVNVRAWPDDIPSAEDEAGYHAKYRLDRSPHGLVVEKTGDVFSHKFRICSLAAKESMLRIEMLGGDVIEILSEEHFETLLPGIANASDGNIQQVKNDIATIISKHRATSELQKSSSSETLTSASGNRIGGAGMGEKRGFSSDVSATSGSFLSDETQAKQLPAWNQWREPTK
ncbi:hypothetical protein BOTNAR_0105g00100 [Botryotinia narcissicola]|uniref:Uncharacterized protein n=1 Tax=Botryotinia narcissicola TaxID=278944 RepID=A0A4Z1IUN7_9HELO|nr:hypothetical protein BOTNAR_0105g00100 [Botryotinia narcissicola]